jgi:limonene-1,2-epoxide hydrolase
MLITKQRGVTPNTVSGVTTSTKDLVVSLWAALAARNWSAVGELISDDGIYYDAPLGPAAAARGPEGVVSRLRLALEGLASYRNFDGRMVAEGDTVMYEHSERWEWPSGETVLLPFVSVHQVAGGKIALWADYWDYKTLLEAAPPSWQESLMSADLSWMYDATGQV